MRAPPIATALRSLYPTCWAPQMAVQEPVAGARVLLGGKHRATVRYVGPIEGQQGTWVGIEYDEAGKGKHDGSHGGRRYFCAHDPTAGSFVRLPKFLEAADFGRSLVAAALERYGLSSALERAAGGGGGGQPASGVDPAQQQEEQQQMYVSTASNRRVTVELLAPEASARRLSGAGAALAALVQHRISSLVRHPSINLLAAHYWCAQGTLGAAACLPAVPVNILQQLLRASRPLPALPGALAIHSSMQGSGSELRAMLPGLTELDLSDNLFSSWTFVAELATALPSLAALNLSGNRLALPSPTLAPAAPPPAAPASLAGLQTLVLNGCGVAWPQAVAVAQLLPTLRELHLCANGLASLHLPAAVGRSGCDVASAAEAAAGISLLLLGAPAAAAPGSGSSSSSRSSQGAAALLAAAFGRLEVLDLENNALSSWADVALLSTLPCLRSLLLSGNRLEEVRYEGGEERQEGARTPLLALLASSAYKAHCSPATFPAAGLQAPPALPSLPRRLHRTSSAVAGRQPAGELGGGQPAGPLPGLGGSPPVRQPPHRRRPKHRALPVHRPHQVLASTGGGGRACTAAALAAVELSRAAARCMVGVADSKPPAPCLLSFPTFTCLPTAAAAG